MIPAREALARLQEGNRRFTESLAAGAGAQRKFELTEVREPMAIILGCSDARVPAEIVFDQGLGDLFVIRVAGNIVAPSQVASIEFAAERFHTRLVVVLGHTQCGAVTAALEELRLPAESRSRNLRAIVQRVSASVQGLYDGYDGPVTPKLVERGVRLNVRASVNHLRHASEVLEQLSEEAGLLVVGAEYAVETGRVDFFDVP